MKELFAVFIGSGLGDITEEHTTPFDTKQNFLFCSFKRKEHFTN
jgi:hypothetical protein